MKCGDCAQFGQGIVGCGGNKFGDGVFVGLGFDDFLLLERGLLPLLLLLAVCFLFFFGATGGGAGVEAEAMARGAVAGGAGAVAGLAFDFALLRGCLYMNMFDC